ncbi:PEP-utilizing enzyme [Pseudoalteromonas sp. PS5]|uniref:PEP-utilizing enzyme n=1 Tax=Pseudoalteromonas sp. PS5 TaxID=1437473 RepID=UPI000FFECA9A|nr:phosphoenolpyruvate synthase [Pseudoalteromonas sp. PS5]
MMRSRDQKLPSKVQRLIELSGSLSNASVLPVYTLNFERWRTNRTDCLNQIQKEFDSPVIVRSCTVQEDSTTTSNAGKFTTELNVNLDELSLTSAINSVFSSYDELDHENILFIQPMLLCPDYVGVAFSHIQDTGAEYYVISADENRNTEAVTSGATEVRTWFVSHQYDASAYTWQNQVINLIKELKELNISKFLDIEFAIENNKTYLLQVRPLIVQEKVVKKSEQLLLEQQCIAKKLKRLSSRHPYLVGKQTIYGVMPDWNPAEIIGIKPRPLALSLYKFLITDGVWARHRAIYKYRDVGEQHLMTILGGTPYIDVRASFNSFIPASIPEELAEKLANHYLDQLIENPASHDKVEFDIVFSSFDFQSPDQLCKLEKHGFTKSEISLIENSLKSLTEQIIIDEFSPVNSDLCKITQLIERHEKVLNSDLNKIDKIFWLLQDCKSFGTLPFAGLARAGFVAIRFLKSMVYSKLISQNDYECFLSSIETVNSLFLKDRIELSSQALIKKYGHLRPGTYEITSPRYDENPEKFILNEKLDAHKVTAEFNISLKKLNAIDETLKTHQLNINSIQLFNFIKKAIEAREYSKFIFTRSLSDSLVLIENLGRQIDLSREELSYANIEDILNLHSTSHSAKEKVQASISVGREYYQLSQLIKLPDLITKASDQFIFSPQATHPNFITQQSISADVEVNLTNGLKGKIVCIESADPGYDWLFAEDIAALITKYGGCNSHMAIRAQELQLPAIIGAGEANFERWSNATSLIIDCEKEKVDLVL